jgi:CBS domain-containing protein
MRQGLLAKDLMSRDVVTLSPLTEVAAAARVFIERKITGAPVLGKDGEILGVVSQTDLTRFQANSPIDAWDAVSDALNGDRPRESTPVIAVMTANPVVCEENTPIEEVAHLMQSRRIHRVLVAKSGRLVGIVTAMDLLRVFADDAPKVES